MPAALVVLPLCLEVVGPWFQIPSRERLTPRGGRDKEPPWFVEHTDDRPEPISIARSRKLLGEEAESMTDQEVELIRRHAETMACIVVEMHQEGCRISE
jgi:hypothetical protein